MRLLDEVWGCVLVAGSVFAEAVQYYGMQSGENDSVS